MYEERSKSGFSPFGPTVWITTKTFNSHDNEIFNKLLVYYFWNIKKKSYLILKVDKTRIKVSRNKKTSNEHNCIFIN